MFWDRVQQPRKLEDLALAALGAWVAAVAERLRAPISQLAATRAARAEAALSRHIHTIRLYFEHNIPKALYDKFAIEVIRALYRLVTKTEPPKKRPPKLLSYLKTPTLCRPFSGTNVARRMIEILFTKNLTFLSLTGFHWEMFGVSFYTKFHMLTGLAHFKLDLPSFWLYDRIDFETDIIRFLKPMHSLKYLSLNYNTTRVLKCIVNNCTSIKELHLTEVADKDLETIMLICANIEYLSMTNRNHLRRVLEMCYARNNGAQFKLKSYSSFDDTPEQLQAVVQMCPLIQCIELFRGYIGEQSSLPALTDLKNLRELKLIDFEFFDDQVKEVLQVIGHKLEDLHLKSGSQVDLNALNHISQTCPNLKSLNVDLCKDMQHLPCTEEIESSPFRNLKKLVLNVNLNPGAFFFSSLRSSDPSYCCSYRDIDENTFLFLFSNCFEIESIKIGRSIGITEDMMFKLLDINPLTCLKELIVRHHLSACVLDRIVENCSATVLEIHDYECSNNFSRKAVEKSSLLDLTYL